MTKEDWDFVENELKDLYGSVKLKCDQFNLSLCLQRINQFNNGIVFYVDGIFKGKWLFEGFEENKRFCRPTQTSVYSEREKKDWRKFGKKFLMAKNIDLDKKITSCSFYWTSFSSLKRHLIKNNKVIELVRE